MPFRLSLLAALALTATAAVAQPVTPGTRLDGIAAVVGDQVVLYSDVDALAQQAAQGQPVTDDLWSRALDQIIGQRVLIDKARRDTTVTASDAEVDQEVDASLQRLAAQAGGEDALAAAYGRPLGEIRTMLRPDVRDELLLQQFRGRRLQGVTITPGEVRAWFERIPEAERPLVPELVRVAHVVKIPKASEAARAQARAFANALRDSALAGQATLEDLARRHSTDPGSARNGGRYANFPLRSLDPTFAAAAASLEIGRLSPPFETAFGFHVLRVDERAGGNVSFVHILIPIQDDGSGAAQARATLETLRDSVVTFGVPFEAIARRHSDDAYSAARGGFVSVPETGERDLRADGLGPAWKATLDTLEVGEISGVGDVTLLDGTPALHFVWLQRRTPAHPLSVADDYALLSQYALQEKRQRVLMDWIRDLRRSTYVDIRADRYVPEGPGQS